MALSRELLEYCRLHGQHLRPYFRVSAMDLNQDEHLDFANLPSTTRYQYNKTSPASKESSSDRFSDNAEDDQRTSLNKEGSPESSVTSRKLEWDSLADIGYNTEHAKSSTDSPLSTIERIVLERHYKMAFSINPTKNKATAGIKTKNRVQNQPNAHSTPISPKSEKSERVSKSILKNMTKDNNTNLEEDVAQNVSNTLPSDEEIQTVLIKNVCASSQTTVFDAGMLNDFNKPQTNCPVIYKIVKSAHKHPRFFTPKKLRKYNCSKNKEKYKQPWDANKGDGFSKVDSFEFVPGYMFNKTDDDCKDLESYPESSVVNSPTTDVSYKNISPTLVKPSSFTEDLDTNIKAAIELIETKPEDEAFKADVVKDVVDTLLKTDYPNNENTFNEDLDANIIAVDQLIQSKPGDEVFKADVVKNVVDTLLETDYPSDDNKTVSGRASEQSDLSAELRSGIDLIIELINKRHTDPVLKNRLIKNLVKMLINTKYADDQESIKSVASPKSVSTSRQIEPILKSKKVITSDGYCQTELNKNSPVEIQHIKPSKSIDIIKNDQFCQTEFTESVSGSYKILDSQRTKTSSKLSSSKGSLNHTLNTSNIETQRKIEAINKKINDLLEAKLDLEKRRSSKIKTDEVNVSMSLSEALSKKNIHIPPLDLKSSPEESREKSSLKEMYTHRLKTAKQPDCSSTESNKSGNDSSKSCLCSLKCTKACMCKSSFSSSAEYNTARELVKLNKAYSKYGKCKSMQKFFKDYESLIKKYQSMKKIPSKDTCDVKMPSISNEATMNSRNTISNKISSTDDIVIPVEIRHESHRPPSEISNASSQCDVPKPVSQIQTTISKSTSIEKHMLQDMMNTIRHIENRLASLDLQKNTQPQASTSKIDKACSCLPSVERKCKNCLKRFVKNQVRELANKPYEKPVAYDLILQSSDSILQESYQDRRRAPLDRVVVKIPKSKTAPVQKNDERALRIPNIIEYDQSTDDQLKDFSSLNNDSSSVVSITGSADEVPVKPLTLHDYLRKNRPKFIQDADKRRKLIQEFVKLRSYEDDVRKKIITSEISGRSNLKNVSVSELRHLLKNQPNTRRTAVNMRLFNPHEIIKNTTKQYKNLPEVRMKRDKLKTKALKSTNRLMAELFVKQLRRSALKGIVNFPHNANIVSL